MEYMYFEDNFIWGFFVKSHTWKGNKDSQLNGKNH